MADDAGRVTLRLVRKVHLRATLWAVLPLFLLSWWKRGFWVASIASVALYVFLASMIYAAGWFDHRLKRMRRG